LNTIASDKSVRVTSGTDSYEGSPCLCVMHLKHTDFMVASSD